jgi:ribonuclease E
MQRIQHERLLVFHHFYSGSCIMTDEAGKAAAEEQEKKVRKVTTGAWWKSAEPEEPEEEEEPAEKKVPRKRTPRKKKAELKEEAGPESQAPAVPAVEEAIPVAKKEQSAPQAEAAAPEPAAEAAPVIEDSKAEAESPPVKKKRPRKRGGKKKKTEAGTAAPAAEPETAKPESRAAEQGGKKVSAKLLINAEEPEECRIAIVEDGRLEAFHVTTAEHERTKNNIYKGRIVSIESSLQAAFVEIGTGRNGFLPFIDIHPEYFREDISEENRALIRQQQWRKLKIEDVVSKGQEVLVQVVKEVTGSKGANITTYLSLPGRCLVLMPGSDSSGISRKISGEERRGELRQVMADLSLPEGIGYIIRTASAEITKTALEEDLAHLVNLWEEIRRRGQSQSAPSLVYEDQDTVLRFLRDHFSPDIEEIVADTQEAYDQVLRFVAGLPETQQKVQVKLHRGAKPIFNQHNIEEQIESIYQPQVQLPSGGSIVIDPTEALVAIDVNSGRTSQKGDFDQSIFLANMEAADELARQLRLRDLGGLIVVDFIDMRSGAHIREVEKQVRNAMKRDKAKVDISRISRFGLMQISRQKMGAPIERGSYNVCEYCGGRGVLRSVETLALHYLRRIQTGVSRKKVRRVEANLPLDVGQYLLNKKRTEIAELESRHQADIRIRLCPEMKPGDNRIEFLA